MAAALACTSLAASADPPRPPDGRGGPAGRDGQARPPAPGRWYDRAYGHNHYYPRPGTAAHLPPRGGHHVTWHGTDYRFVGGVWYGPGPGGYVVVQPPVGIVVAGLPAFATVVTIAGLTYLYANNVYYRAYPGGGYEVVPPPAAAAPPATLERIYVYPRNGQSAQQQASDEYECHRWAVTQTGFDPSAAATAGQPAGPAQQADYQRARTACLEGRGYTVR